ncbi:AAA ATPase-like protein [Herbihabitans rhizosphaerae]|uniref:AAA ATPase-like protein n=1 Tax=Herbihabitans rhizosphaerae TaxID=1872711 RepID=A0A4Q7KGI4_9PSEU|nr:LuxR C-terminal-related transcriptional regulator [Herbihabitans rhizosphaerae]RZS34373.1 AAA ATPase-like protein [Herbihabitans rhizosphaerae]
MGVIGRDAEFSALDSAVRAAVGGRGRLVMLRGEPGAGGTALLNATAERAVAAGLRVVRLDAAPAGRHTPFALVGQGTAVASGLELAEAARALLSEWTADGPVAVLMDDLHHADDESILVLREIARELPHSPALLVTWHRTGTGRLETLEKTAEVHDVGPLDRETAHALVANLVREPSEEFLRLCDGASGNPWLLTALAEATGLSGAFARRVTARVAELGGPLARAAAVLDDQSTVDNLAAVLGSTPIDVVPVVDDLVAAGLVHEDGGVLRFHHDLVRAALCDTSSGLRRHVAHVLSRRHAPPSAIAAQLADAPGGVDSWTLDWLREHAEPLAKRPTPAALRLLADAVPALGPGDPRQLPLRAAHAEALLWSGRFDDASRTAHAVLAARPDADTRLTARMTLGALSVLRADTTALEQLDAARAEGPLPPRLAALAAFCCLQNGDFQGMGECVAAAQGSDDPLVEVYLLQCEAAPLVVTRQNTKAIEVLDRIDALLETTVYDRGQWLVAKLQRAGVLDTEGDLGVREVIAEARPVALELGGVALAWLYATSALFEWKRGEWDATLAEIDEAFTLPDLYGLDRMLRSIAAMIHLNRGDIDTARAHAATIQRDGHEVRGVAAFYEQIPTMLRALMAHLDGRDDEALTIARQFADGGVGVHSGFAVTAVGTNLVRIAVAANDLELARRLVDQMAQTISDDSRGFQSVLRYCRGLVDGDVVLLREVQREFTEQHNPMATARVAQDVAMVLAASGHKDDAKTAYDAALSAYAGVDATGAIQQADAAMRATGVRRGVRGKRSRPKQGWDSLTDAEQRVAELVAQGRTNSEIAGRLFISPRTVQSHVSRILRKLGFSSRVEIATGFGQRG